MQSNHVVNVVNTYASIANEFSHTRFSHWNKVKLFIESLEKHTILLDIGCGNGKYTNVRSDLVYIGCDITRELLAHADVPKANESMKDLFQVSCERLPLRPNSAGAAICIAVLHHIPTFESRIETVIGILQTLCESGGKALITVWAYEQRNTTKRDTKWKRVSLTSTDYLIPWRDSHMRFYHLFTHDEAKQLCDAVMEKMPNISYSIEFELDNWILGFKIRHPFA